MIDKHSREFSPKVLLVVFVALWWNCTAVNGSTSSSPRELGANDSIRIQFPNGGETLVAGSDTTITWKSSNARDTVAIDVSTDGGKTWKRITANATGGSFRWTSVPNVNAQECLIRTHVVRAESIQFPPEVVLSGHKEHIFSICWSPDGKRVATVSADKTARIWDALSGASLLTLIGHEYAIKEGSWSPDGKYLATVGVDSTIRIWNTSNGSLVRTISGYSSHDPFVSSMAWSHDSKRIATAANNTRGYIFDVASGTLIHTLIGHTANITCLTWSRDDAYIASSGLDPVAHIWDVTSGANLFNLQTEPSVWIEWSPVDDRILLVQGSTISVFDASGLLQRNLFVYTKSINYATWSPDGKRVASTASDLTMRAFESSTAKPLAVLQGYHHTTHTIGWNRTGTYLAASSLDSTLRVFDADGQNIIATSHNQGKYNYVAWVAWSPKDERIAATGWDSKVATVFNPFYAETKDPVDTSDIFFSIVKPTMTAVDVDMGTVLIGRTRDSVITTFISNPGAYPFRVNDLRLSGPDSSDFSVVAPPPFTVAPHSSQSVSLRFHPSSEGIKAATITIVTQSDTLRQRLIGNGVPPVLEVLNDTIDFGIVALGTQRDTMKVVTIKNISNSAVHITKTRLTGTLASEYSILNSTGFDIQPNETHTIDLRFTPTLTGLVESQLAFDYDHPLTPEIITLRGIGFGAEFALSDDSAAVGETRLIRLNARNYKAAASIGALAWHATVSSPEANFFPSGVQNLRWQDNSPRFELQGTWNCKDSTLASFSAEALLGSVERSVLRMESLQWSDTTGRNLNLKTVSHDGSLTLLNVCAQGGKRLVNGSGTVAMYAISPQPIGNSWADLEFESSEDGLLMIDLIDVNGIVAKQVAHESFPPGRHVVHCDVRSLHSGCYFLRMQTATEVLYQRIQIFR